MKKLCSRVIWIDKGEVRLEGDPDEVCEAYLDAYFDAAPAAQDDAARSAPKRRALVAPVDAIRDARLSTINRTPYRNDIEILRFKPHAASFGSGAARIVDVRFVDRENRPLSWCVGGEDVTLRVSAFVSEDVQSPIVGFFFNDHLGQSLFGENTYLTYRDKPASCGAGDTLVGSFSFAMPVLPVGEYSVNVAIADGTQQDHVQLHWIHDALPIRVHSSSVANYLLAVPMLRVGVSAANV